MKKKWLSAICLTLVIMFLFSMSFSTTVRADGQDIEGFVTRMYRVVLGREPEEAGLQDWSERLRSGNSCAADIVLGFFFSPEYESKAKSHGEIVTDFYSAMLDRTPDSAGYNDWVKHLDVGMTKTAIAYGFVGSQEFGNLCASYGINPGTVVLNSKRDINFERTYFVYRLYQNCLGRAPEEAGLESWCGNLDEGGTGSNIAYGFVFSEEYRNKNATDTEYVDMLYRTMLGREADEGGKATWTGQLEEGYSREHVLNGFLFSQEFGAQCERAGINVGEAVEEPDKKDTDKNEFEYKGYLYDNGIATWYYYIVKNNGSSVVTLNGEAVATDESGAQVGTSNASIDVLAPGETSLMEFYFSKSAKVDKVDVSVSSSTDVKYQPVISNLGVKASQNPDNLTLAITNNGSCNAQNVMSYALFMDSNGNVVDFSFCNYEDCNEQFRPGATLAGQMTSMQPFDHVEYFLTGRSDGSTSDSSPKVSPDSFSVKEYWYEPYGYTECYLQVKNNSSKTVGIKINVTAYDASGKMIGAGDAMVDIVGSGEETMTQVFFDSVTGIDHFGYAMSFNTQYSPVLNKLSITENQISDGVEVSVTNNSTKAVKLLQGYALFFDAGNNLIYANNTYFIDDDGQLKAGGTLTQEIMSMTEFSTVKCFYAIRK